MSLSFDLEKTNELCKADKKAKQSISNKRECY
jgi:hypothetical protein